MRETRFRSCPGEVAAMLAVLQAPSRAIFSADQDIRNKGADPKQQVAVYIKNRVIVIFPNKEVDVGTINPGDHLVIRQLSGPARPRLEGFHRNWRGPLALFNSNFDACRERRCIGAAALSPCVCCHLLAERKEHRSTRPRCSGK